MFCSKGNIDRSTSISLNFCSVSGNMGGGLALKRLGWLVFSPFIIGQIVMLCFDRESLDFRRLITGFSAALTGDVQENRSGNRAGCAERSREVESLLIPPF